MAPRRAEHSQSLSVRVPFSSRHRTKRLWRFIGFGMLLAFALLSPEILFEKYTNLGQQLKLAAYNLVQIYLGNPSETDLPITIIDISDLQPQAIPGTNALPATSRDVLEELIRTIADQSPAAIGVDIDFSPDAKGWIDPIHDPHFFRFCLNPTSANPPIPVFLGVHRAQDMKPENWLGDATYQSLAAGIAIPRDTRRMLHEIEVTDSPKPLKSEPLPSMASRLAKAYAYAEAPYWIRFGNKWAIDMLPETPLAPGLTVREFLVDYSARSSLEHGKINYEVARTNAAQLKDRIYRKMVIIGAAELDKTADIFPVMNEPVTGTVIHACAAYTLAKTAPLYEPTLWGNLLIDLILSFLVFLAVGVTWYSFPGQKVEVHRLQVFVTFVIASVAVVVGVMAVRTTRVMWDGFLIVLFVLCMHSSFEKFVEWLRREFVSPRAEERG